MTALDLAPRTESTPMDEDARFWDRIAPGYARRPIGDEAAYERKLAMTRAVLAPDADVLEIGCGTGGTAVLHAPHVRSIRAIDIAPKMIEIARARAAQAQVTNVQFEVATVDGLALPDARHDAVLMLSLLHLLRDPDAAIRAAHATLRPGGVLVTSTGCIGDGFGWLRPVAWAGRMMGKLPYLGFLTRTGLRSKMAAAGFVIEQDWAPGPRAALFLVARKPL